MKKDNHRPKILILGAGFGGTYVARYLRKFANRGEIDVTIVDRRNHFLFTPLLHEVATGSLTPSSVAEPLREIFSRDYVDVIRGEVEKINLDKKLVTVDGKDIDYDYLVIASGAQNTDYGVSGVAEHAVPLKRLADALKIRRTVIGAFEKHSSILSESPRLPRFAVVGGGATGVELATELAEFSEVIRYRYYPYIKKGESTISLIDGGSSLLSVFPKSIQDSAKKALNNAGVRVCHGCKVSAVTEFGVERVDSEMIPADAVFWCAGVVPSLLPTEGDMEILNGRILVDEYLHLKSRPEVFSLGDVASFSGPDGKVLPMLAQVAIQQSKVVSKNIMAMINHRLLEVFEYHSKGNLVSLGRRKATGVVFGVPISGILAWFIWRNTYLFKFASWKKRIKIAFEWFIGLFFARETTEA